MSNSRGSESADRGDGVGDVSEGGPCFHLLGGGLWLLLALAFFAEAVSVVFPPKRGEPDFLLLDLRSLTDMV